MNNQPKVLMISSDTSVTGGMSRVIELYKEYKLLMTMRYFSVS